MALTVEDGTGLANANSYVSLTELRTYASERIIASLPGSDAVVESLILKAMDLVETYRDRFKGTRLKTTQALQWPRTAVYVDGVLQDSSVIPKELKNAVCQMAIDAIDKDLQLERGGRTITKEKVGELETEYSAIGSATDYRILEKANAFLKPLLYTYGPLHSQRI